jgi:hypothetical protein
MEEEDFEWEEWNPSRISFLNHMLAGSTAGLAEHVSVFPIDTLKTHIQVNILKIYFIGNCEERRYDCRCLKRI